MDVEQLLAIRGQAWRRLCCQSLVRSSSTSPSSHFRPLSHPRPLLPHPHAPPCPPAPTAARALASEFASVFRSLRPPSQSSTRCLSTKTSTSSPRRLPQTNSLVAKVFLPTGNRGTVLLPSLKMGPTDILRRRMATGRDSPTDRITVSSVPSPAVERPDGRSLP